MRGKREVLSPDKSNVVNFPLKKMARPDYTAIQLNPELGILVEQKTTGLVIILFCSVRDIAGAWKMNGSSGICPGLIITIMKPEVTYGIGLLSDYA